MPRGKIKNNKIDAVFSKLVRERAEYKCEAAGWNGVVCKGNMECSHHIGRAKRGTRWLPDNSACHCSAHHWHFTNNPLEHAEWVRFHLGADNYAALRLHANQTHKLTNSDKERIYENLKGSLRAMEEERKENNRKGRIEFDSPYAF